jgi:hypothetical protein
VAYEDFPISGLISYHMDDNKRFMPDIVLENDMSVNLTGDNIAAEREFRFLVLNWLNNGKPKVFRSATEGNYIVRLMNVNLSPNDTLGRMLYTFNSNAYSVEKFEKNSIISAKEKTICDIKEIEVIIE